MGSCKGKQTAPVDGWSVGKPLESFDEIEEHCRYPSLDKACDWSNNLDCKDDTKCEMKDRQCHTVRRSTPIRPPTRLSPDEVTRLLHNNTSGAHVICNENLILENLCMDIEQAVDFFKLVVEDASLKKLLDEGTDFTNLAASAGTTQGVCASLYLPALTNTIQSLEWVYKAMGLSSSTTLITLADLLRQQLNQDVNDLKKYIALFDMVKIF